MDKVSYPSTCQLHRAFLAHHLHSSQVVDLQSSEQYTRFSERTRGKGRNMAPAGSWREHGQDSRSVDRSGHPKSRVRRLRHGTGRRPSVSFKHHVDHCSTPAPSQVVVIDGRGHLLGRLASIVAKQLLQGQHVVSEHNKTTRWIIGGQF